ncbi:MAG TPA: ATP-binding cassette domain-containing protein, partial [Nitrospiria bacterium]|nr:ATP-binding cassette domain-containing protein [Nitrospiria bacterium]
PGELSGGQRQRVALGRAIIRRPRVFLMDEPLSNLDARLRIEMREEIKRLHQEIKITTVYVTHDQEEAMSLSSRIAIYNEGMIQQCGTPAEVYETPSNLFVAGFIGSPSMNLIDGDLLKDIPFLYEIFHGFRPEDVIIGIRPPDIDVSLEAGRTGLGADLLLLEPAGSDIWAIGKKGRMKIKGRAASRERISPGDKAFFNIPLDKLHIFDKTGGGRLDQRV